MFIFFNNNVTSVIIFAVCTQKRFDIHLNSFEFKIKIIAHGFAEAVKGVP